MEAKPYSMTAVHGTCNKVECANIAALRCPNNKRGRIGKSVAGSDHPYYRNRKSGRAGTTAEKRLCHGIRGIRRRNLTGQRAAMSSRVIDAPVRNRCVSVGKLEAAFTTLMGCQTRSSAERRMNVTLL